MDSLNNGSDDYDVAISDDVQSGSDDLDVLINNEAQSGSDDLIEEGIADNDDNLDKNTLIGCLADNAVIDYYSVLNDDSSCKDSTTDTCLATAGSTIRRETKLDDTFPDAQFAVDNFHMWRADRTSNILQNSFYTAVPECLKSSKINGTSLFDSRFTCCPWAEFKRPDTTNLLKWIFLTPNNSNIPSERILDAELPINFKGVRTFHGFSEEKLKVAWIGHATVYVQFDGIGILTDPMFGDSCGPSLAERFNVSYKRYRKAPCRIKELPFLDAVLVSNNHYDHLEKSAVYDITECFSNAQWFVTLEQRKFLLENGVNKSSITELDWWQETEMEINGQRYNFICTPSQSSCRRSLFDTNSVLWCSWVIRGPTKSFYFAGDTGYYETLFKTIGQRYGPFDLAVIPIGGYEPRFITKFQHVDPEEAVKIHRDVRSKQSVGIHWGTFELTNEFYAEPPQKVEEEMKRLELDPKSFVSLCHGETWCVGDERERPPFMNAKPQ